MMDNIAGGMGAAGGSGNQKALDVLHNGFKNKPAHDFYKAGDPANLPQDLDDAGLTAQLLGPPGDTKLIAQMTNTADQYLAEPMQDHDEPAHPFPKPLHAHTYPDHPFTLL